MSHEKHYSTNEKARSPHLERLSILKNKSKGKSVDKPESDLYEELRQREQRIVLLESTLQTKEEEIAQLKKEIIRLQSISMPQRVSDASKNQGNQFLIDVSDKDDQSQDLKKEKSPQKSVDLSKKIYESLIQNVYLRNLEQLQLKEIVEAMYSKEFPKGETILKDGDPGDFLFIVEKGSVELRKDGEVLGNLGPGRIFGEHSFIYNCSRTSDVIAFENVKLWVLSKAKFQQIMLRTIVLRQQEYLNLLNGVPLFNRIPDYNLCKIIDIIKEVRYCEGENIFRQGTWGDTLFIIKKGSVEFSRRPTPNSEPQFMKILNQGMYFGEKSLLGSECYNHDATAAKCGCLLLIIDREAFKNFIDSISGLRTEYKMEEFRKTNSGGTIESSEKETVSLSSNLSVNKSIEKGMFNNMTMDINRISIDELHTVATIGVGRFSRIELVVMKSDTRIAFALKQIKKKNVVNENVQNHVLYEKKILKEFNSNFIVKLYKTFKDRKYVYMLMEVCLGGDLTKLIKLKRSIPENEAKFYIACIIEAIKYLHSVGIVYRDLKPENVLIDEKGYCKLHDFGFAKKLTFGRKTFSFCGTPEYIAPEVILNKGHDFSADYWGIGVIIYELLVGKPPFVGADPIKTYNIIMRGFDSIGFPSIVSKNAQSLIRRICKLNPNERLGYAKNSLAEVQKQKWFEHFQWNALRNMVLDPPWKPVIKDYTENSSDDEDFPRDDEIPPDENSGWDRDF